MSRIPGYNGPINPNPYPPDGETGISIYLYRPWFGGALAGVITFGIALIIQLVFMRKRGTRWIHGLLAFGCLMELGGYAARIKGHANMYLINVFIAQYFLIVVAPIPIAAAIYLVLSYTAQRFPGGQKLIPIRPRWLVAIFVVIDIVTIAIQVCGAALIGVVQTKISQKEKPPISSATANHILLAGLAIQTAFFGIFVILLSIALTRVPRLPARFQRHARLLLLLDTLAASLILLRTVYRLAVECQGYFGSANSSQVLFTVLEFLPVILAVAVFCVVPLSRFIPTVADAKEERHEIADGRYPTEVKDQY